MPSTQINSSEIQPGMAIIHANRLENLRDLTINWLQQYPLSPLENETILVQSNGMAQWLKLALASSDGLGICTAVNMQLPAHFLWQAYQQVSGHHLGVDSPFSKDSLIWRIFKLLPDYLSNPAFSPLRQFLANDADLRKRYALALCLADLYDQYQVYRADWLALWSQGLNDILDNRENRQPLAQTEVWQAELWRSIVFSLPEQQRQHSRAFMHEQFLQVLANTQPQNLPRRLIVFGISALPRQFIKALAALGQHTQVLICIHNPCRYYWADLIAQKDLLKSQRRRQSSKPGFPKAITESDLHLHANPLLAAWGKQGRDYMRLWDEYDEPEHYRDWFQRIDLFDDYGNDGKQPLLQQVQQAILDLTPLPDNDQSPQLIPPDDSLAFHIAHSPQREVEILQDQLLALFTKNPALNPRDIIVMTPDIDSYAPYIQAVFGQIDRHDPRYLPFSIADQRHRGQKPLLIGIEKLLHLPESRFTTSDLLDLLEISALRKRFAIAENDLPVLRQWIQDAGIRWGLHAEQRQSLDLPEGLSQNTWDFGLNRMLLGYATGATFAWREIEPYPEIGGLSAALLGPLALLLNTLEQYWQRLRNPMPASEWGECFRNLLTDFFMASDDTDQLLLTQLLDNLERWQDICHQTGVTEALPLAVVREAWLTGLDQTDLNQRFMMGSINFCTLMPMRAIPFQVVCLLGMNDGDFPRNHPPLDFDLMAKLQCCQPGDRSRREDDRYLFLEALLSARQQLYISWIGRSVRDNTELPSSVLVSQLRDYLKAGWQMASADLLTALTTEHRLQPFHKAYFQHDSKLFTYAYEWRQAHAASRQSPVESAITRHAPDAVLTLPSLADFLRFPVKCFFQQRLKVHFDANNPANGDNEPFNLDGLSQYQLADELLAAALAVEPERAVNALHQQAQRQYRQGKLPLAGFSDNAQQEYLTPALAAFNHSLAHLQNWPIKQDKLHDLKLSFQINSSQTLQLEDWLGDLRGNHQGQIALLQHRASNLWQNQKPKWHSFISPWITHLAACAQGLALRSVIIGPDTSVAFAPIPQNAAYQLLDTLVQTRQQALQSPLPLACKTAFAWLEKAGDHPDKAKLAAQNCYLGTYNSQGEAQNDLYLARAYPDFNALFNDDFQHLAQTLYLPLYQALKGDAE